MIKRLMLLAVVASAFGMIPAAQAKCATGAGTRNMATVTATKANDADAGPATVLVKIVAYTADACASGMGSVTGPLDAPTTLTITGDGAGCSAETHSSWDPFGFGAGIHDAIETNHDCSADVSWGGFTSVYTPDPAASGPNDDGAGAFLGKDATVENAVAWVDGVEYRVTAALGRMYTGVGVDA